MKLRLDEICGFEIAFISVYMIHVKEVLIRPKVYLKFLLKNKYAIL